MFLTEQELYELTGKTKSAAQRKTLCKMGIEHLQRPDGTVVVSRQQIEQRLSGNLGKAKQDSEAMPDWSKFNG